MLNVITRFRALVRDDKGQDLIEYALLAGLISLVAVGTMRAAGTEIGQIWTSIQTALEGANPPAPAP